MCIYIYVIQTYTCVWLQHNHVWVLTWACGFLSKQINAFQLRMACFFMPLATPNRATPKSCYPFQNISKKKEHNLEHRLKPSKEKHRPGGNLSTCNCTKLPKRPSFSKFGTQSWSFSVSLSTSWGDLGSTHICRQQGKHPSFIKSDHSNPSCLSWYRACFRLAAKKYCLALWRSTLSRTNNIKHVISGFL